MTVERIRTLGEVIFILDGAIEAWSHIESAKQALDEQRQIFVDWQWLAYYAAGGTLRRPKDRRVAYSMEVKRS